MANQLIQKLLEAEQQADAIVRKAKENWVKKLKEAQVSAEEDIQKFRAHEEEKFQKEYAERYGKSEATDTLDEQVKTEIEHIKAQFKKHRDQAVALLITGCVRVDIGLNEVERRQVQLRFNPVA